MNRVFYTCSLALCFLIEPTGSFATEDNDTAPMQALKMRFQERQGAGSENTYIAVQMLKSGRDDLTAPTERSALTFNLDSIKAVTFRSSNSRPPLAPPPARRSPPPRNEHDAESALSGFTLDAQAPDFLQQAQDSLTVGRGWLENDIRSLEQAAQLKRQAVSDQQPWSFMSDANGGMHAYDRRTRSLSRPFERRENRLPGDDLDRSSFRRRRTWSNPDDSDEWP